MICKKLTLITIIIATFLLCNQFTSQKTSATGKEKPSVNVYGLLTDTTNHSIRVENITIAGRFNDIAVFQKPPPNSTINPDVNTTRLDLCTISEIRVDAPTVLEFNKRDYIEITIISNDRRKTQNRYIIPKLQKIFCDEINEAGPIEKELSFVAIKRLQIQGCKKQEEEPIRTCRAYQGPVDQSIIDQTITKTESLIHELESTANQLPNDQQDGTIKSQILQLLGDLKDIFKNWFA
jgi:hypothetical protein